MTLKEKIQELVAEDGPNIPARTLAIYCGISPTMIGMYLRGERNLSEEKQKQVEKGLKEFGMLVYEIVNS